MVYYQVVRVLQPGKLDTYMKVGQDMVPLLEKVGFKLIGGWRTTIGDVNEGTALWAFEDMAHLEKAVAQAGQNKEFMALYQKLDAITISNTTKVMQPTPASPLK